jgi:endonuclease I
MKKLICAALIAFMPLLALAETSTMTHKDGSRTIVVSDSTGSRVDNYAKGATKPSGSETNAESHKANVDRVVQEGKDKGNPVVPPIVKS